MALESPSIRSSPVRVARPTRPSFELGVFSGVLGGGSGFSRAGWTPIINRSLAPVVPPGGALSVALVGWSPNPFKSLRSPLP